MKKVTVFFEDDGEMMKVEDARIMTEDEAEEVRSCWRSINSELGGGYVVRIEEVQR